MKVDRFRAGGLQRILQLAHENAKLRYDAPGAIGESARTMGAYEDRVLSSPPLDGVVLRYGFFYGPGTWYRPGGAVADQVRNSDASIIGEGNAVWSFVHIDDAVSATVASLTAKAGVYNIVDDDPLPIAEWLPAFSRWVDAPEPRRVSVSGRRIEVKAFRLQNITADAQLPSCGQQIGTALAMEAGMLPGRLMAGRIATIAWRICRVTRRLLCACISRLGRTEATANSEMFKSRFAKMAKPQ